MNAVLDDVLPVYRHRERHATQIAAPPEAVWSALHAISAGDLRLTRALTSIRALPARLPGGRTPRGGLPADRGFIQAFMDRGYRELRADPPRALVAGAAGQPWRLRGGETADVAGRNGLRAFERPGFVLIATSFELEALGDRTRLSTETRVQPTDAAAARAFRPYWWAIRAGSGLIRRDVLQAVRRRAEHPEISGRMRLPNTAHTSRPWRIHELTADFRLEDVWALPTPGGPDDFPRLMQNFPRLLHGIPSGAPSQDSSRAARTLWAFRWKLGALLGWDDPDAGHGSERPTLRDRLPMDLRETPSGPDMPRFTSLYLLDDEWAAEIVNRTVHGVMHIGWVPDGTDGYRGQMAVYVKPNGLLGTGYMAAIKPFRHLIVYPPMMRQIGRRWRAGARSSSGRVAPT
jgi:Protein of unknown function (DUF2867)